MLALALLYGAGISIGILVLLVSRHFAWLLIPILAAIGLLLLAKVAPSDVCDTCGREFTKGIPEKCPSCGDEMGADRKRYKF